ncbi:efflux RND transporter periplasmic adaptor subunit [Emticicia sp. TH156]|uniref:efflux RND transporter periplasmic adaptor subunit n=1 Tax=Emticicia sp. TH156 TaxID=2067454 RepID=UPI000C76597F|nr:efflux RND transporter periplasmic adaptor subunit [Emticicia sp. TH156]PLK42809.1 efflux transporter periplasmic adaptor subunit [Emticicia sp. TH156]
MKTRIITIAIIVGIIGAISFKLVANKKKIDESKKVVDRSQVPVYVATTTVALLPVSGNLTLPAVLEPKEKATISTGTQGKIETLNIELGSRVNKGQIIGTIDSKVKQINLQSTELTINKAKTDYERNKDLLAGNAINETAVNDARFNYENNQLQAAQLKQQIADARIISPISGIVTDKKLTAGEYVNMGTVIASLVDVSQLKTVVYVNEKDVYELKLGQPATVTTDVYPTKTFNGKIIYISPQGDDNHNYKVDVLLANGNAALKAGTYVKVEFNLNKSANALQIPKKALGDGMKNPYVFVVEGKKAVLRKIVLGREIGENVEVLSGLNEGETIITEGIINIVDGSNVLISPNK